MQKKTEEKELLIDYFERKSEELSKMDKELKKLSAEYRNAYDKQLKEEIHSQKSKMDKEKWLVKDYISKNSQEFILLKNDFDDLFQIFLDDEFLKPILTQKMWLTEFKRLDEKEAQKKLQEIKERRKEVKDVEDFLKKWHGQIDAKSLTATWKIFEGEIEGKLDKDEVLGMLPRLDQKYRRKGWLIIINEPFIHAQIKKFIEKLKKLDGEEKLAKLRSDKSKGKGTTLEYKELTNYKKAKKERVVFENKVINLLLINPSIAKNLRKTTGFGRNPNKLLTDLLRNIPIDEINEKEWKEKMKKRLKKI